MPLQHDGLVTGALPNPEAARHAEVMLSMLIQGTAQGSAACMCFSACKGLFVDIVPMAEKQFRFAGAGCRVNTRLADCQSLLHDGCRYP